MAAPYTLAQLMTPISEPEIRTRLLSLLEGHGLPALSQWAGDPAGPEMIFVRMISQAVDARIGSGAPAAQQLAAVAAGRTLAYGEGAWLTQLLERFYRLVRGAATKTTFTMAVSSTPASPPYSFRPGDLVILAGSGHRYVSTSAAELHAGATVDVDFEAEAVGSTYADDPRVAGFTFVTAPAGLLPPVAGGGDYTDVVHGGASTGSIIPFRVLPEVAPTPHTFALRIDTSGEAEGLPGSATYSLSVDGGPFDPRGLMDPTLGLAGGTVVNAFPGPLSPSFAAGDVFSFATPGSPRYVQGTDEETDAAAAERARGRWPALAANVLDGAVQLWVKTAYPPANRIQIQPDPIVPGRIVVIVADTHGAIDTASLSAIDAYIRPKLGPLEDLEILSATALAIVTTGNVRVRRQDLAAVQAAAQTGWVAYLASVPMGGLVVLAKLVQVLVDAGAADAGDVTPIQLNGAALDIQLAGGQVPSDGNPAGLAFALTWMAI